MLGDGRWKTPVRYGQGLVEETRRVNLQTFLQKI
jgi:hypothetical protein